MVSLHLPFLQARDESPCDTCAATPCCTLLPLIHLRPRTALELDHFQYVLGFANIEVVVHDDRDWQVFYRQPCRHLEGGRCSIYDSPARPYECRSYNPYSCTYRPLHEDRLSGLARLDFRRMQWVRDQAVVHRETGDLVKLPSAAEIAAAFPDIPVEPMAPAAPPDPVREEWRRWLRFPSSALRLAHDTQGPDPCGGCEAWCCKTLTFPLPVPSTVHDIDRLRFSVCFPGVEIGVADGRWVIVVRTTCRHLQDSRCSLYGKPERPVVCKAYDARDCRYVIEFGTPRPKDFMRLSLEEVDLLAESISFDEYGNILGGPSVAPLRQFIEDRLRTALMPKRFVVSASRGALHREVAACVDEALRSLGYESVLGETAGEEQQQIAVGLGAPAGPNAILFNLDPLREATAASRVWDFSSMNLDLWRRAGVEAKWLPLGWVPRLARMAEPSEELDVVCFGSLTQRRRLLLQTLSSRGYRVEVVPGAQALDDPRVAKAKIVLMLSSLEAHFDSILATYLLANRRFVIAERTSDPDQEKFQPGVMVVATDRILQACLEHLENAGERRRISEEGHRQVLARSLAKSLRGLLTP